mmetsp:Transcript_22933/g.40587  ORF Transcript_22933/g.40587 Transcript_22933/m.40587 type:complete len:97 (+) Transcript_22933:1007-1297(+)
MVCFKTPPTDLGFFASNVADRSMREAEAFESTRMSNTSVLVKASFSSLYKDSGLIKVTGGSFQLSLLPPMPIDPQSEDEGLRWSTAERKVVRQGYH